MAGAVTAAVASVVTAGVALASASSSGSQSNKITNAQIDLAGAQNTRNQTSFDQLQQLMSDPGAFFSSPVFQKSFEQGLKGVSESAATKGFLGSGTAAAELLQQGMGYGQQQFLSQEQLLAGMSGTGFNPAGALSGATASNANTAGQNAGLFGALNALIQPDGTFGSGGAVGTIGRWLGNLGGGSGAGGTYSTPS